MATRARSIRLHPVTYRALEAEASRRHVELDELADEFVRDQLLTRGVLIQEAVESLEAISAQTPEVDALRLVHERREERDGRGLRRPSSSTRPC